ncbi:MAG: hypothetical protein QOH12_1935 [Solirubrobacteraceae bacterium]|jgi:hypothetical membrane protein|nr:hypothetical protein [Solirubrobacteraceae bacterium]
MGHDVARMPRPRAPVGPIVWVLSVQYFVVQVVVASAFKTGYAWGANTISDLGNTRCGRYAGRPVCSPLHVLMNASFVVLGITMCAGAILVGRELAGGGSRERGDPGEAGSRVGRLGFGCLGVAGLGTIVVGVFAENTVAGLHQAGASLPFVLGNLGVLLVGASVGRRAPGVRAASVVAGTVGLVGLGLFLSHTYVGLGKGGMERVTAYPQDVWLIGIGVYLLTGGGSRLLTRGGSRPLNSRRIAFPHPRRVASRRLRQVGKRVRKPRAGRAL